MVVGCNNSVQWLQIGIVMVTRAFYLKPYCIHSILNLKLINQFFLKGKKVLLY